MRSNRSNVMAVCLALPLLSLAGCEGVEQRTEGEIHELYMEGMLAGLEVQTDFVVKAGGYDANSGWYTDVQFNLPDGPATAKRAKWVIDVELDTAQFIAEQIVFADSVSGELYRTKEFTTGPMPLGVDVVEGGQAIALPGASPAKDPNELLGIVGIED